IGPAGRRSVEDGHLRNAALQSWTVSRAVALTRLLDRGSGADRHCLRRAGCHGAAKHEEVDRILIDQPSWLRGAGNLQLYTGRTKWRDVHHAGTRNFYWRTIHAGGNSLRAPAHV